MLRIVLSNSMQQLEERRLLNTSVTMRERSLTAVVSSEAEGFRVAIRAACKSVGRVCGTDAYHMALLMLSVSYYGLNHGTLGNTSPRSFETLWCRIASCSAHLGSIVDRVIMHRDCDGYLEMTRAHSSVSTMHTSRDNIHKVDTRRNMIDMMYGARLMDTVPDMMEEDGYRSYTVVSERQLHTCIDHALQDNHEHVRQYRNHGGV